MSAIHAHTIDSLSIIIQDMHQKMLRHIAKKLDLDTEELIERYCTNQERLQVCNTIQVEGIAIQEGPVYLPPPPTKKTPVKKRKRRTVTATGTKTVPKVEPSTGDIDEESLKFVEDLAEQLRVIFREMDKSIGERIRNSDIFSRDEMKSILQPINTVYSTIEPLEVITRKQWIDRINRNLTTVMYNRSPGTNIKMRTLARENTIEFFENIISRVKCVIIQNLASR
jgi:hypothetical protein